jgi:UDP-glucose 4-epimerase
MVIPNFVHNAIAGRTIEIHGDGHQTRCFCHVGDTIRALQGLMDARELSGDIFNVGSQNKISILELAERIKTATGSDSEIRYIAYEDVYGQGIEDMIHRQPSTRKINGAIGWEPEHDLEQILADVIAHIRATPVLA